ncbi:putative nucleotidyltransferase [Methanococcus maripaludis]|uniref:protein adenylyltransferase n=1 Tax=Methanococcus maripaludis TaxID=39152 RepID=A0A7J9NYK9_METMI|nr:nucleotidyltransferase domain-containing protein [Methanococcus maripaludis]MBA2850836.1 putative nucleotidyltransferase [Methanococcus maripaludis]
MGVANWFQTFCNDIRIPNGKIETIRRRYKSITEKINSTYWGINSDTSHSLYVGSYGRGTDTRTSDVDIIVELPDHLYTRYSGYSGNGQSALLQDVKNTLLTSGHNTRMRGDGQVVVVDYSDGISFDVVPAFLRPNGKYHYPDTNGGGCWRVTDPRSEISAMSYMNILTNQNLKRLCRMTRIWKANWNVNMDGLLIDTFAYNFMRGWVPNAAYSQYDAMSRDFFKYLSTMPFGVVFGAPGSNSSVFIKEDFSNKANKCYELALDAIAKQQAGYEYTAKLTWREIYGSKFPR